tara:strand:- start:2477 stop:3847 length:1371 start_codon:yes stop_codon:yes gene_type:complete
MGQINSYFNKYTDSSPLVIFRIGFGLLMSLSIIRFWSKGWIESLYLEPDFHFSYYGFEWVQPLGNYTYLLFIICFISSFFITIGYRYKWSVLFFFLSFTYIELMDKTTYLNHYYFISILSFLLFFIPANAAFSFDSSKNLKSYKKIPLWSIDSIKILITIVYLYAGISKINSDWLFQAMPLKIWLQSKYDLPIIGNNIMQENWFHYLMSWGGLIYDLSIPFLLMIKKTRFFAFIMVVFFHLFTVILFPIGMFPYIMILSSLIFFDSNIHNKILNQIKKLLAWIKSSKKLINVEIKEKLIIKKQKLTLYILSIFFAIQIVFPFRYLIYPGELFWNEEGYRFSWRVMLIEKKGYTNFKIKNTVDGSSFYIKNEKFLTPFQEKQMSFQPDFILEYAHYLGDYYSKKNKTNIEVYADSFVALNGRQSQRFIDPNIDLYLQKESINHKKWILPLNDEIKGF